MAEVLFEHLYYFRVIQGLYILKRNDEEDYEEEFD